ncbi:hypothetical protein MY3957_009482 [Beauveria namnaoensis]
MHHSAEFAELSPSAAKHMSLDQDSDFQSDADEDAGRGPKRKRPLSVSILQNLGHPLPNAGAGGAHNSFKSLPREQGSPGESTQHFRPQDQIRASQREGNFVMTKQSSFTPSSQNAEFPVNSAPMMHDRFQQRPVSTISTASHPDSAAPEYYQHSRANPHHHAESQGADQDLPPYDLVYSLVDLYFKNVNTWCPILHKKTTLDTLFGPSALQEADLLGLAVEATSTMVSPSFTSIYTLRAMVLPEPKDFIEEESRRRLFWMVYLLDRYATIATAFEFALDDREIDRSLPCRDDLWMANRKVETKWFTMSNSPEAAPHPDSGATEHLGAFSYYIEVLGILSKIHQFLKQPVNIGVVEDVERWQLRYKDLDSMLTSWKYGLPGEYSNMARIFQLGSRNLSCTWLMLHATYHTAVIRLHSSAAYPTTRSPIFTPSYSASQRCLSAVENIAALAEFAYANEYMLKLGPPFAFTVWVSARLLLVHGSTVEHKLSPQIAFFVDILRALGAFWPVAQRYCNLLQRVLDEHRDSEQNGDGITPSSVKILADMRRTAFDLDFLISRQPRHGTHTMSRVPSVTSARTPAPIELEYLDVFDFFNVPRLPLLGDSLAISNEAVTQPEMHPASNVNSQSGITADFNITNFMMDANSDWFKQEGGKFLGQG